MTKSTPESAAETAERENRWRRLVERLQEHAALLEHQGTVTFRMARRRRVWSLRFVERKEGGRPIQRALYVGGDLELVRRVRAFLRECRRRARWDDEAKLFAKVAGALTRVLRRAHKRCLGRREVA